MCVFISFFSLFFIYSFVVYSVFVSLILFLFNSLISASCFGRLFFFSTYSSIFLYCSKKRVNYDREKKKRKTVCFIMALETICCDVTRYAMNSKRFRAHYELRECVLHTHSLTVKCSLRIHISSRSFPSSVYFLFVFFFIFHFISFQIE